MRAQNPAGGGLARSPTAGRPGTEALRDEVVEYSRDPMRFLPKIDEVRGAREPDPRQPGILAFLRRHALRGGKQSVLELGRAAGNVLRLVLTELERRGGPGAAVGVELVPGWALAASRYLRHWNATVVNADITEVDLGSATFDP